MSESVFSSEPVQDGIEGWIRAKWETPPKGKKRKVYSLTAQGKKELKSRSEKWGQFTRAVNSLLKECIHE